MTYTSSCLFHQAAICAALRESWCFHLMITPAYWPTAAYFLFNLLYFFPTFGLVGLLISSLRSSSLVYRRASFAFPYQCWGEFNAVMSVEATKQRGYEPGEQHK